MATVKKGTLLRAGEWWVHLRPYGKREFWKRERKAAEREIAMDIPRDKNFPSSAVQCDGCGGNGCEVCRQRGWLVAGHPLTRRCAWAGCDNALRPNSVAVYCSNDCAQLDDGAYT